MEPGKFPGPLYPPDAAPRYAPSHDSDFVVACKRAAAHLGAWPWDPDSWDDSYSNRFAHGDGWDHPTHAGIAGLQKWSGTLDPTGNVGEKTFNFLRSVVIQQGRTHAGEPAWDQVCINLTAAAYENQNPPLPVTTARAAALDRAIDELGTKESPPQTNQNPYGKWYGEDGVPWCAIFTTWAYENGAHDAGFPNGHPTFQSVKVAGTNDRYDYVPYVVSDARGGRYGLTVTTTPMPGDLVCFDWNWNGEYDHIGLFEKWTDGTTIFSAIEGNTSLNNNSNGGEVMRRSRNKNSQGTVFVRVREP